MEAFLLQFFIFLASACIAVPIAKKLGLGSVLGYLIAGIIIGPFGLSLIGKTEEVMHFTEFGVVMMLFLVGLELKPALLWQMRKPIIGMGGSQVGLSTVLLATLGCIVLPWQQALALGLILSLSSTAIVLQTLSEKGLMNTPVGRSTFSVLLFQDLAVIPMLAFLPLLATLEILNTPGHSSTLIDLSHYAKWIQIAITLGAILSIFFLGKFAARPIFRGIAATRVKEVFVAAALAIVIGISLLMMAVGLSPALGTFLAGVVLADSEYRHELESHIEPFKGLLLGIFFISIGASLNFLFIGDNILLILGLVIGLIACKWLVLIIVGRLFKVSQKETFLFAVALAQGGEFAFVLFQFGKTHGVLAPEIVEPLISAVAISMFLAPILFIAYERLSCDREEATREVEHDLIDTSNRKVILAGFGRLGTDLGRMLIAAGIRPVIIDHDPGNVEALRKFGFEVYYGDITRPDLLESAGASKADLLIITIGEPEKTLQLIQLVQNHYPNLKIIANAHDRKAVYDFLGYGITNVRRETFGSALCLGQDALVALGFHPYEAYKTMRLFRKIDEDNIPRLYKKYILDEEQYVTLYQKHNTEITEVLQADLSGGIDELERAWTTGDPGA